MKIKYMEIDSFGKIKNKRIDLSKSLNIVEGENESGKSTVMAFVSFILYGNSPSVSPYVKASSESACGKMYVESDKYGDILIERSTSLSGKKNADKVKMLSMPSMKELSVKLSPGEYLLGVGREFFHNTTFVSQSGASEFDGVKTSEALQNMLLSGNEKTSPKKGLQKLDELRKFFKHKKGRGGAIPAKEDEISECETDIRKSEEAKQDLAREEQLKVKCEKDINSLTMFLNAAELEKKARFQKKRESLEEELEKEEEALKSQKKAVEEAEEKLRPFKDGKVREKVNSVRIEIATMYAQLVPINEEKVRLESEISEIKPEKILSKEEYERLIRFLESRRKEKNKCNSLAYLSFTLTLVMIAVGVVLAIFSLIPFSVALFGISLVSSFFGYYMLTRKKQCSKEIFEETAVYGFEQDCTASYIHETFERRLTVLADKEKKIEFINQKSKDMSNIDDSISEKIQELLSYANELSVKCDELRYTQIADECENALNSLQNEITDAESKIQTIEYRIKLINNELRDLPKTDEKAELNSVFFEISDVELESKVKSALIDKDNLSENLREISVEITRISSSMDNAEVLGEKLKKLNAELSDLENKYEIVLLAENAIEASAQNIRMAVTPNLIECGNSILSSITDGQYTGIGIDEKLEMNGITGDISKQKGQLSFGTNEAAYLALRIALSNVLCREEVMPLMLDESLAYIDNKRSSEILSMLSSSRTQTVLFTCGDRESRIAEEAGIEFRLTCL